METHVKNGDPDPEDIDRVNVMYGALLDHLLIPNAKKEELLSTQSIEKKKQMLKMHSQLFEPGASSWGDKDNMLLTNILKSKIPDLSSLSRLRVVLASANREFMTSFLDNGGVSALLKTIESRIDKSPLSELDVAVLYEILSCCKAVMNNQVGMDGFVSNEGSLAVLAKCLDFEFKTLALLVLEILSVCCANNERNSSLVLDGLRLQAQQKRETPMVTISRAVVQEDVEVKHSVLLFVNTLIMSCSEKDRLRLRSYLGTEIFDERVQQALTVVNGEMQMLTTDLVNSEIHLLTAAPERQSTAENSSVDTAAVKLRRRSMIALHGRHAYDKRQVEKLIESNRATTMLLSEDGSFVAKQMEIKSNSGLSVHVNPMEGSMAGLLYAAKNADKIESKFLDFVGGKKTKRRWCELDETGFKWCAGHDKEADYKGHVPLSSIRDIRSYTLDTYVSNETQFCFEFDTPDRVFAMGCETAEEKDFWVTALQRARDKYIMSQASYHAQHRELKLNDVSRFAEMFQKQVSVYISISEEDSRSKILTAGVDFTKLQEVGAYLTHEAEAVGSSGSLLTLLQELLLIPAPLQTMIYSATSICVQSLRKTAKDGLPIKNANLIASSVLMEESLVEQMSRKIDQGGAQYAQLNKLALQLVQTEAQVATLSKELKHVESQLQKVIEAEGQIVTNVIHAHHNNQDSCHSSSVTGTTITSAGSGTNNKQSTSRRQLAALVAMKNAGKVPSAPGKESALSDNSTERVSSTRNETNNSTTSYHHSVSSATSPPIASAMDKDVPNIPHPVPPYVPAPAPAPTPIPILPNENPVEPNNVEPDDRFAKFIKMRKMLPEGAVRQKMMIEGFTPDEIDAFFNDSIPSASPPSKPPVQSDLVESRFSKYDKMRKMLPEGAVRQKMQVDGFSAREIDAYFDGTVSISATQAVEPVAIVDERYAKFEKMRKMLPEGAVRQKMMIEGFTPDEIDGFFSGSVVAGSTSATPTQGPPVGADERFAKYEKMRKMLPEGAVRQKMQVDGFSQNDIDIFFIGASAVAATPVSSSVPPMVIDERYAKYEKMRKMLPEGAVRQKMQTDGFNQSDIDAFFSGAVSVTASPPEVPVVDERFAKYEKMRKMLPEGAVRQKMQGDGLSQTEIDNFFNGQMTNVSVTPSVPAASGASGSMTAVATAALKKQQEQEALLPPPGMAPKSSILKPKTKVKALFWQKLKNAEVVGTVWHKIEEPALSEDEYAMLEECFGSKVSTTSNVNAVGSANSASSGGVGASGTSEEKKLASVLDGKRTQNVLILLGKLRKTPEDILALCVQLNPQILDQELTRTLIDVLPTSEEHSAVSSYVDAAQLDAASKFVFHCRRLPRLQVRLECHEVCFTWPQAAQQLQEKLEVINKACDEFHESEPNLKQFLGLVLSVGNFLNGDTARGQAYGVKLDIFGKLSTLKANTASQGTLLHLIVQLAEKRATTTCSLVLSLSSNWLAIFAASEISWKQLQGDIAQLQQQVTRLTNELAMLKPACENVGLDFKKEDLNGESVKPLHHRLESFLSIAKPRLAQLQESNKTLEIQLETLFNSFGESLKQTAGNKSESETGEDAVKKFWLTFADFGRALNTAIEENKARKLAAEKAQKLAEEESTRTLMKQQQHQNTSPIKGSHNAMDASDTVAPQKKTNNLFGNFHSTQATASANDLVAEFKNKLAKQMLQQQNSSS